MMMFNEDFLDDVPEMEAVFPGMIFREVDFVCEGCGETITQKANPDGSNLYWCPLCEEVTEL